MTTVFDGSGNPVSGSFVTVYQVDSNGTVTDANGNAYTANGVGAKNYTGTDGTATVSVLPGLTYEVCANTASGAQYCAPQNITVSSDTTATVTLAAGYTISGQMTFNSNAVPSHADGVHISFGSAGSAITGSGGNYSVSSVFNGAYSPSLYYNNGTEDSASSKAPNYFSLSATDQFVNVSGNDVTQNVPFNTHTVKTTVQDGNGNTVTGSFVTVYQVGSNGTVTDANGNTYTANGVGAKNYTGTDGTATVSVLPGLTYQVCAYTLSSAQYCAPANITVNSDVTVIVTLAPIPSAPTNLTIPSPTQNPVLSWTPASSSADSYNIYRDGSAIGFSSTTTFTDSSAPQGTHTYYVTAVNAGGESGPSNSISVLIDRTPPQITYSVSPAPNSTGWNNTAVIVTFTCGDNGTGVGIASCTAPVTLNTNGTNQTVTGTAVDNAGNTASVTTTAINIDQSVPMVGTPAWSSNWS